MKSFEHLIITRFNLNLYARDKHDAPTRTERWLDIVSRSSNAIACLRWRRRPTRISGGSVFSTRRRPRLTAAASAVTSPSARSSGPYFTAPGRPDA